MQTTICLIRHGETDWNREGRVQGREDIALNADGIAQAECCASYLAREEWDVLITSPLKRARQTAECILAKIGIRPIYEMVEIIERDYGESSGLTLTERKERYPDGVIPGQEELQALTNRGMKALEYIAQTYSGKRILVVAHGGLINAILYELSQGQIGTGITVLKNACINLLCHDGNQWEIKLYNETTS